MYFNMPSNLVKYFSSSYQQDLFLYLRTVHSNLRLLLNNMFVVFFFKFCKEVAIV
jgi:hypothetical protein